jgi:hypothetical protein
MTWQAKKLDFNVKDKLINLSGACFWYWNTFYSFLESCGVSSSIYLQFGKEGGKYQLMRSILELLERQQRYDIIKNITTQFYNFTPGEDGIDKEGAERKLDDFRKTVGSSILDDEIDKKEIERKIEEQKKLSEERQLLKQKLQDIKKIFLELQVSTDQQKRGFDIEKLFFDLLELEEFEVHRPYRISGEQLDGHFKYDKFDYIVEIKWTKDASSQPDLSIFDGKIKGKGQSTRGFFLSINGFDENSVSKFSGDAPRIILMDGQDFYLILEELTTFYDLMKLKTDALARKGNIYISYGNN